MLMPLILAKVMFLRLTLTTMIRMSESNKNVEYRLTSYFTAYILSFPCQDY